MSGLADIAHKKAIALLNSIGAMYRVEYNGEVQTNIPIPVVEERRKITRQRSGIKYHEIYKPVVEKALEAGLLVFKVPVAPELDIEAYRGALSGYLSSKFGNGKHMTSVDRVLREIEVLIDT